ncbi:MAG: iron-sulfur cluster carrier protein ApbC [Alphaproteobacteria bacterium]|nr:MAG: iron-sulfur cluster carrier protein ApbC [Alphaproteobacteria bacterium]
MTAIDREKVLDALRAVTDPESGGNVVDAGMIQGLVIKEGQVGFTIEIPPDKAEAMEALREACEAAVARLPGVKKVMAVLTAERPPAPAQSAAAEPGRPAPPRPAPIPGVRNVVAVASGKGGVGKSTTAINLAVGLSRLGLRVAVLDADIYGPSVPMLLGLDERPELDENKKIIPMQAHGIVAMSIGSLIEGDTAMIWRGPMVMGALQQLLADVAWDRFGPIDVMVVDMPPGTGDAQLTMAQRVPLAGAVIVSTPQDIALIDARKGINMFERVEVPVLGVIENMSTFVCPHCGEQSHIFGHGGARETADKLGVPFLGAIPLHLAIRETSDAGAPIVASDPSSDHAKAYMDIAAKVAEHLKLDMARGAVS